MHARALLTIAILVLSCSPSPSTGYAGSWVLATGRKVEDCGGGLKQDLALQGGAIQIDIEDAGDAAIVAKFGFINAGVTLSQCSLDGVVTDQGVSLQARACTLGSHYLILDGSLDINASGALLWQWSAATTGNVTCRSQWSGLFVRTERADN